MKHKRPELTSKTVSQNLRPSRRAKRLRIARGRPVAGTDKRRQILDGAHRLFIEKGFDAASMNDVYAATGVSKSTLYSYFKDKQELFVALIDEERERHARVVWATLDEGLDVASALTRFGERVASISAQDWVVRAYRTVLSVADRMPDLAKNFYESGRGHGERRLAEYLDARVADGNLAVSDTLLAAQQFFALCQAAFMRARLFGVLETEPLPDETRRVVASAVKVFLAAYGVRTKSVGR